MLTISHFIHSLRTIMAIVNDPEKITPPPTRLLAALKGKKWLTRSWTIPRGHSKARCGLRNRGRNRYILHTCFETAALGTDSRSRYVDPAFRAESSRDLLMYHVGEINEQYPQLPTLALLVPESWILRPFLSLFGFGPTGPIKGASKYRNSTF
jgi:hypothetical protein